MTRKSRPRGVADDDGFVIEQNNSNGGISFWERSDNQSVADRHGVSLVDYIHAMYGFLRQAKCRHVLMIGCGGGTLATMLRHADVKVTIADIDGRNFEIARTYFHMPDDVECHVADGRDFLRRDARRYDAIVLDAYADNVMPKHFLTHAFFELVKARLRPRNAMLLVNLMAAGDEDRSPDRVARLLKKTWSQARLLDSEGCVGRNVVAVAGAVRKLKRPKLAVRPCSSAEKIANEIKAMDFRPLRA
ncbi:MAG: fused MFS/spermidine synthase [Alphaproteobacteria bacterium]|nr:fused MFS/spermidine synthase [Alphaproteobacteria bacterium]